MNEVECAVQITNNNIVIYGDTEFESEEQEIKINDLEAVYINKHRNQVVFKTACPPNEFFKTESAASVVRTLLALRKEKPILVYDIQRSDLSEYYQSSDLPSSKYQKQIPHAASESTAAESNLGHQPDKRKRKLKGILKNKGGDTEARKPDLEEVEEDKEDTTDSDTEFDGADNELARNKSKCMITEATLDNFSLLRVIGEGAFGRVFLAKKDTGEVYAMKRIRKDKVLRCSAVENILLERKILSQINHPLLLSLRHVFSSEYRFYFFLDYVIGGDLMKHLKKMKNGFSLTQVKFIAAQLVLAFECLHENKIVHRDLKPENVLIDEEGYIKLADFGLAKDLNEGEGKGACGTLEYMAPEIVNSSKGHNFEVDWWTLGVLMYELYYTKTPFIADSRKEILYNIMNKDPEFPEKEEDGNNKNFKNFKSIVTKLLRKDPKKRLGRSSKNQGAKKVKKHAFFKSINWAKILDQSYEAPYIPEINTRKIRKYLQSKGCKIGVARSQNQAYGKLAETDLSTKVRKAVDRYQKNFE